MTGASGHARLVVHGHFYQPPRENPWTESVPVETSAAPFHDWNERITAECYRPNANARVIDDHGRVVSIVNNYGLISFDLGPTLASWLAEHHPDVLERIVAADREHGGGTAQAYNHMILPLADARDVRTQVRWGLADFEHRFGRPAEGMWLPETAVDDAVLAVLAEEGVRFTVLAPGQAARTRPLGSDDEAWRDVGDGSVETNRSYRWLHPDGGDRGVDVVFYRGDLSHEVAFGIGGISSEALVARARTVGENGGLVCIAADGETFGHHHHWADRALAYALVTAAPRAGLNVGTVASFLADHPPEHEVAVRLSSWSCSHGVERWRSDCGCATGGEPGWHQRWRAPLRDALDLLRDATREIFERRGAAVLRDGWVARDAYVDVLLGRCSVDDFTAAHITGDRTEALTLLESQRHAMLMYTSCGWFFNDLAGLETVQVLRYAARVLDLLADLGEPVPVDAFLETLAKAESNRGGDGRDVWRRHVEPARVDARRVVAHLALLDLLERQSPSPAVAGFDVTVDEHERDERGSLALSTGVVSLAHRRTGRASRHAYAALHLGGLEVLGATRPADDAADGAALEAIRQAFAHGARVTRLLRLVPDLFGDDEFSVDDAISDAPDELLHTAADGLAERFVAACERLLDEHLPTLRTLSRAGYPVPAQLKAPAEAVLGRRFEDALAAGDLDVAGGVVLDAAAAGLRMSTPTARDALERIVLSATSDAVASPDPETVGHAIAVLHLAQETEVMPNVERAQELVYEALSAGGSGELRPLAAALGLAV